MKRGETLKVGWEELIEKKNPIPDDYYCISEICEITGQHPKTVDPIMRKLRKDGKIDFMRGTRGENRGYFYKR